MSEVGRGGRRAGAGKPAGTKAVDVTVRERLVRAKADREEHLSRIAELALAEREGRLVDADAARLALQEAGRRLRDAVLAVPGRVAVELVGLDERGIERVLTRELRAELSRLADSASNHAA